MPRKGYKQTPEHRERIGLAKVGNPRSAEVRAKISKTMAGRKLSVETRRKMALASPKRMQNSDYSSPTTLEQALSLLLQDAGLEFEAQVAIRNRLVDFFVPSHKLVFEADGSYWHRRHEFEDPGCENRRDEELLEAGVTAVIHLNEIDLDSYKTVGTPTESRY